MGPTAGLYAVEKKKKQLPLTGNESLVTVSTGL
jgi:hypothetical protein